MDSIIEITDNAIQELLKKKKANHFKFIRLGITGGGCAGFSYKFDLVNNSEQGDIVIEEHGAKVIIDEVSITYIQGSVIDYKNDLIGQSFEIKNPNATSECGCGTSFSL